MLKKPLVLIAVIALLGWGVFLLVRPAAYSVSTAEVIQGSFVRYIEEEGRTRLLNTYTISAPIQGFLQRVTIDAGDRVEAGDVLFVLEPTPTPGLDVRAREQAREALAAARSRLDAVQAMRERTEADQILAARERERIEQLFAEGLVSESERERAISEDIRATADSRMLQASVESMRHDVESARVILEIADGTRDADEQYRLEVRSPISGVVLRRERCCEGVVMQGQDILELGNMSELEVRVDLLSTDAVRVEEGMSVEFHRWGGEGELKGRVRRIEPSGFTRYSALGIEEQRVSVFISFSSDQSVWQQLGEGYRVEARIEVWRSDDALQIPVSALFRHDNAWHVFTVVDQRAYLQAVEPGQRSGLYQQISRGLEPGQRVITHPAADLSHGDRVSF